MRPPKVARWLLGLTVPARDRDDVVANLDDLYRFRRENCGRVSADAWYWRQALSFSARVRIGSSGPVAGSSSSSRNGDPMSQFFEDVRFALRSFRKSPGFLFAVVGTLGLGFGANIVIFAVVNSVVLKPLPFPEADELVWVWSDGNISLTLSQFTELQPEARSFADLTAFGFRSYSIQSDGGSSIVTGVSVSTNHFDVFGLRPMLGRPLRPEDGLPGSESIALISNELWRSQFGADSMIVGRRVELFTAAAIPMVRGAFTGTPHTVVGVLPPGYQPFGFHAQVYTPLIVDPDEPTFYNMGELSVIGRMVGGTGKERVQSELARLGDELPSLTRTAESIRQDKVTDLREALSGSLRTAMFLTLGAVGMVLLIACANVANLVLGRTQARQRELAIRSAVGAGRGRLIRQLLTESLVLSAISASAGLGAAFLLLPAVGSSLPPQIAPQAGVALEWTVLWFAMGALVVTALISGVAPALMNTKTIGSGLSGSQRTLGIGRRRHVVNNALVVSEIALALVLAHGAGLLVLSFTKLTRVDPGFTAANVMTMQVAPSARRYGDSDVRRALFAQIMERAASIPGVESVGAIHFLPIAQGGPSINFQMDPADDQTRRGSGYRVVTPGYIETMGIPLLQGRAVDETDVAGGALVGMINHSLAEQLWPGEDPIGRTIYRTSGRVMLTVVGVVGDVNQTALGLPPSPEIYIPLTQTEWASGMNVVVRTSGAVTGLDPQLRQIVKEIDPNLPVTRVAWMDAILAASVADWRFYGLLFSSFAALALVLGGIGIYGVVSAVVGERTDEIGICLALGATRETILRREVVRSGRIITVGIGAGLLLAFLATRLLSSLLYEVSPSDPIVVASTSLILVLVAMAGVTIPARRASRIDPLRAIRAGE